jgi:hypothetical protein
MGVRDDYLRFMMFMEVKFASVESSQSSEANLQLGSTQFNSIIERFGSAGKTFENRACQGFCRVPNHLLFSIDKDSEK